MQLLYAYYKEKEEGMVCATSDVEYNMHMEKQTLKGGLWCW
jgi:hypothetical protein